MQMLKHKFLKLVQLICFVMLTPNCAVWASVSGSISGTVKDPLGSVLPHAQVEVFDLNTGASYSTTADDRGFYILPVLPVGRYELDVKAPGFSAYQRKNINLDTNAVLTFDVALQIGGVQQTVSVSDNSLHIETSSTQLGDVISDRQMTAVPLNGRSYTDLLSLQPGVSPATSITSSTVQDVGATVLNPSGDLNPGTLSVNGQRESANAFIVNGSNTEESRKLRHGHHPESRRNSGVSHRYQQFRCRVRRIQRWAGQRRDQVGQQCISMAMRSSFCETPISMPGTTFRLHVGHFSRTNSAGLSADRSAGTSFSSSRIIRGPGKHKA